MQHVVTIHGKDFVGSCLWRCFSWSWLTWLFDSSSLNLLSQQVSDFRAFQHRPGSVLSVKSWGQLIDDWEAVKHRNWLRSCFSLQLWGIRTNSFYSGQIKFLERKWCMIFWVLSWLASLKKSSLFPALVHSYPINIKKKKKQRNPCPNSLTYDSRRDINSTKQLSGP